MKSALLLDVVVREGSSILKLLASKDQPLLVWGNAFLILDLGLDILNGVRWLNLQGDGLASEGLDKDLHTSPQSEHKMKSALLLDVVVREGSSIIKLLTSKDEPLLVWGNSLLVLDLGLDILNGVRGLHLKGDGLASESLDKDLHTTSQSEHKMKSALLLDVVVREGPAILKLLASKDEPLLIRGDSLLVLDLSLDILNGVRGLHLKSDGFAGEGLHEDLHTTSQSKDQVEGGLLLDVVVREGSAIL